MDMFTKKRAKNAKNMLQLVGYYTNVGEEIDINVSRRYIYIYIYIVLLFRLKNPTYLWQLKIIFSYVVLFKLFTSATSGVSGL